MKNEFNSYPSFYYLSETIKGFWGPQGYKTTPIGDYLIESENNMHTADLNAVAMVNDKGETLSVQLVLEQAFDIEMEEENKIFLQEKQYEKDLFERDYYFDYPMGIYVPRNDYLY